MTKTKNKKRTKIFNSYDDYVKEYFPKSPPPKMEDIQYNPSVFGETLANQAFKKIKQTTDKKAE